MNFGAIWSWLKGKKTKIGAALVIVGKVAQKAAPVVGPLLGADPTLIDTIGHAVEQVGTGIATVGVLDAANDARTGARVEGQ